MERLTEEINPLYPTPKRFDARYMQKIVLRLAGYEKTGLTPEQIQELKERDIAKKPEHAPTGYGWICPICGNLVQAWQKYCGGCGQKLKEE